MTSSGWTRQHRCEYRQTTVQEPWGATLPARRFRHTTDSTHGRPVAPNVLERHFEADHPNERWTTDITCIWTWEGWLYLTVVLDLYARRVVGWAVQPYLRTELALEALQVALGRRVPAPGDSSAHSSGACVLLPPESGENYTGNSDLLGGGSRRLTLLSCGDRLAHHTQGPPGDQQCSESEVRRHSRDVRLRASAGRSDGVSNPMLDREAFYRNVVHSLRNGVIAIWRDGSTAVLNDAAYRILGLEADPGHIDRSFLDVLGKDHDLADILSLAFTDTELPNRAELRLRS